MTLPLRPILRQKGSEYRMSNLTTVPLFQDGERSCLAPQAKEGWKVILRAMTGGTAMMASLAE